MDPIKIVVAGANGHMGQSIIASLALDPTLSLIDRVTRTQPLSSIHTPFDVLIDFSSLEALPAHLDFCIEHNRTIVIGITGLSSKLQARLTEAATHIPLVYSPNMSIGINLCFKLLEISANVLRDAEVAIQETHHKHKKDAPSGTALRMGEIIANAWGKKTPSEAEISFASTRLADVKGEHNIIFAMPSEQVEIKHKAEDRAVFAKGALLAAKWILGKKPGLYDMRQVLGF